MPGHCTYSMHLNTSSFVTYFFFLFCLKGFDANIASHILVFYVVGVNSNLKGSIGFFGTKSLTADTLYTLFWDAVMYLELICKVKVSV